MNQIWRSSHGQSLAILLAFITTACAAAVMSDSVFADGTEVVDLTSARLVDGRIIQGQLDPRTNERFMWLRRTQPNLTLASRFEWKQIAAVVQGTARYSVDEFQSHVLKRRDTGKKPKPTALQPSAEGPPTNSVSDASASMHPSPTAEHLSTEEGLSNRAAFSDQAIAPLGSNPGYYPSPFSEVRRAVHPHRRTVRSLRIAARLANWDDDAEPDGLLVLVTPMDRSGHVVPVDASIDFRLVGLPQQFTGGQLARRSRTPARLGEWSRRVRVYDFGPDGAVYQLTFRNFHPGRDVNMGPEALLTARLGVSGVGVFNASDEYVVLRPASGVRDELQLRTEQRFPDGRLRNRQTSRSW